jgi:hypothetical protein
MSIFLPGNITPEKLLKKNYNLLFLKSQKQKMVSLKTLNKIIRIINEKFMLDYYTL